MDQRNTKLFTFMILCFATLILESVSSADDDHTKYASCTPRRCGSGSGPDVISYPFWISGLQESYCGYPGFKVTCVDDDVPILTISEDSYVIKQIYHENTSIHVVRKDSELETCPIPLRNISFDGTPFVPNPNSILSFFFNCKGPPLHDTIRVDCASNTSIFTNSSVAIDHRKLHGGYNLAGSCNFSVSVPVIFDVTVNEPDKINATELAKNGFMLNWTAPAGCCDCEASGGHCGSRDTSFVCYCKDGTEGHPKCSSSGKINWGRKIGIAVGAAGVGVGLTCLAVFIYHRRRKRRQRFAPSSLWSRGLSSDPSSSADFEKGSNIGGGVPIFTYTELEEATSNFDSSKELGDGGYGTVYYGKLQDGRSVAVKRLYENNCRRVEQFMNEVKILTGLRHKNLVSLYGCTSRHSRELLLVYEYVSNGTLADHLHGERANTGSLTWPLRMSIAVETASALMYLHASGIIHRDVKTNNILLDNNFCVKVADFGLSRLFPADVTHVSTLPQGTPGYVDPEYHQCYQLTDRSDVYSFGVVLVELISSMPAVDITRHRHEINLSNLAVTKIQNHTLHELVDPSLGFHRDAKVKSMIEAVAELAFQCLQSEKEMRPSMEEVVESLKHASCLVKPGDGDTPEANPHLRSPDTVTMSWVSRSTTPNSSG